MKGLLLRVGVLVVALAGVLTVVVVARLVFSPVPPLPEGEAQPLEFDEARAVERLVGALAIHASDTADRVPDVEDRVPDAEERERDAADSASDAPDRLRAHLQDAFPRVHGTLQVEGLEGGPLLYTWEGAEPDTAPILLAVHDGIVPRSNGRSSAREGAASLQEGAASLQEATTSAQEPVVSNGEIRGPGVRGAPAVLMATLEAVEGLLAEGVEPRQTILLVFSGVGAGEDGVGSEAGSVVGSDAGAVARVLGERAIRPAWVLVGGAGSATGLTTGLAPGIVDPVALVGVAERGFVEIELTLASEAGVRDTGDAPEADEDESAVAGPTRRYGRVEVGPIGQRGEAGWGRVALGPPAAVLAQAVARLQEPFDARIEGPGRELLETTAPHMDPGTRMLIRNLWLFRGSVERALARETGSMELVRTTATPTFIRAGIDDGADVEGDGAALARVRLHLAPWDSVDGVLETIRDRLRGLGVEVSVRDDVGPPLEPDPWNPASSARSSGSGNGYRGEGFQQIRAAVHHTFPDVIAVTPGVALTPTQGRHYRDVADAIYRFSPFRLQVPEPHTLRDQAITERHYFGMVRFYGEVLRRGAEG